MSIAFCLLLRMSLGAPILLLEEDAGVVAAVVVVAMSLEDAVGTTLAGVVVVVVVEEATFLAMTLGAMLVVVEEESTGDEAEEDALRVVVAAVWTLGAVVEGRQWTEISVEDRPLVVHPGSRCTQALANWRSKLLLPFGARAKLLVVGIRKVLFRLRQNEFLLLHHPHLRRHLLIL